MKENYDFSNAIKNPYYERNSKYGYKVQVTKGEGKSKTIVEEYFVTPEEVTENNKLCEEHLKKMRKAQ
jgi:hypothetical protein